jgi:NDP-sugar pyrophosphorylase family protein
MINPQHNTSSNATSPNGGGREGISSSPIGEGREGARGLVGMIFAAGLGTRFKPWTDKHPKALAVVHGKSLLQRNVEYLQQYGITNVVVNVHHFADQIVEAIEKNKGWGSTITISDETDEVLETGGGIKKAAPLFTTDTIVVINVDILTDLDLGKLIVFHQQHGPLATLAVTNRTTSRYFLFNEENTLCGWRNTKTGEEKIARTNPTYIPKAFSGIHVINKKLLSLIQREGKFSMVDVYLDLAATHTIKGFDHSGSRFIDVGKPDSVAQAEQLFNQ